jgi:formylglycine-generating enzyme required for sulfatase activity
MGNRSSGDETIDTVLLPAGTFVMGSLETEPGRLIVEGPRHRVTIGYRFAVGRFPVTMDEFTRFVEESGRRPAERCRLWDGTDWKDLRGSFRSPGYEQAGNHPAVCVSWEDAQAYATWLSHRTRHKYRLLTEAEWEYAARAGTATPFWWGDSITPDQANYNASTTYGASGRSGPWRQRTVPVEEFEPNPWGLFQMHGNIWEWVEDCWERGYDGAPDDGGSRQGGPSAARVLRGGSWLNGPRGLRSARRHGASPKLRRSDIGFRLACY